MKAMRVNMENLCLFTVQIGIKCSLIPKKNMREGSKAEIVMLMSWTCYGVQSFYNFCVQIASNDGHFIREFELELAKRLQWPKLSSSLHSNFTAKFGAHEISHEMTQFKIKEKLTINELKLETEKSSEKFQFAAF